MCGLVGFVNNEKNVVPKLDDVISQLLFIDMFRGEDATGFAGIFKDNHKNICCTKKLCVPLTS